MLKSIENTTKNPQDIETFVIYDNDDPDTKILLEKFPWVKALNRERGLNLSEDYFNWTFPLTKGEYIWILNDDAEIQTQNWDEIAYKDMKHYHLGQVISPHYDFEDQDSPFSYFPILCRKAIELFGWAMPAFFLGWAADFTLFQIYNTANKIIPLNIRVNHISGRKLQDDCFENMNHMSQFNRAFDCGPYIHKLRTIT